MKKDFVDVSQITKAMVRMLKIIEGMQLKNKKKLLASLRSSIIKPLSSEMLACQFVFSNVSYELFNEAGNLTKEGQTILNTLQLYALHQQSLDNSVVLFENVKEDTPRLLIEYINNRFNVINTDSIESFNNLKSLNEFIKTWEMKKKTEISKIDYDTNIGESLAKLYSEVEMSTLDKRFNQMIVSNDYAELLMHLRYLIKLLKSKSHGKIKINYILLAKHLYLISQNNDLSENIKILWSQSYYLSKRGE